ncbi:DTW domain-containing protein [Microbulbifer sp. GL-2]|nr:DTW domain-containing protein [Microbulbifer sp. GL-2]
MKVLIIQHPQEEKHPFNTGRMAHLCLSNSDLIIAEALTSELQDQLLSIPSALLYPSLEWLPDSTKLVNLDLSVRKREELSLSFQQLIVIDATWRKSKKILHLNPQLQKLPRINLGGDLKSNYTIRKTSVSDGLSTIESIAKAMQLLEGRDDFQSLLKPFEKMIELQKYSHQNFKF